MTDGAPHTPVRRSALVGQIIGALQERIRSGVWSIGARLPVETDLAAEFGVSKITLRQAVQALVHVGMLETIQGNGTFVRAATELDAVLGRYLRGEDLRTTLEVRIAIETEAAGLAATRRTDVELRRLDDIVDDSRSALAADDLAALESSSALFHSTVVEAARNPVLAYFYGAIRDGAERSFREDAAPGRFAVFVAQHAALAEALRLRDGERARELARAHLEPVIARLEKERRP